MNKGVAIFKIIIWTFVALFSIGILFSISGGYFDDLKFNIGKNKESGKMIKEESYDVSKIDSLNIRWFSDSVYISSYDGDKIIVTEKSNRNLDEDDLFNVTENNGTLTLEQERHINIFNIFYFRTLRREIKIPNKIYKQITINFTSGKLDMSNVKTDSLNVKMTSGRSIINDVEGDKLSVEVTSGSADLNGKFKDIKVNETSGSMSIESDIVPSKMTVNVTSGVVNIAIPDNDGFVLGEHKTSGTFSSEFKLDDFGKYKKGTREYLVKITSGSVHLLKK